MQQLVTTDLDKLKFILSVSIALLCVNIFADIDDYFSHNVTSSAGYYGETGILEIPNARFLDEGTLSFSYSSSFPNEFTGITASPFDWLEATYRYVEVENQKYGQSFYSGNQSYKDKGFDFKVRLLKEGYYLPQVALGLRDIAGTGLFSSEYLVATKRLGPFDITSGMGWGNLAVNGTYANPFASLDDRFRTRNSQSGYELGGDFNYKDWFSGKFSLLGGLEYDLKKYGLKFKLEYDTSEPDQLAPNRTPVPVQSRFNFGIDYFFTDFLRVGIGIDRGNQFRLSFTLKGTYSKDTIPKASPKTVQNLNDDQSERIRKDKMLFYRSLNRSLRDESIFIQGASIEEEIVDVSVASSKFNSFPRLAGRTARITSALSPEEVDLINVHVMNGEYEAFKINFDRKEFDRANKLNSSPSELLISSSIKSESSKPFHEVSDFKPTVNLPQFDWTMNPALRHQIGGPEAFYLGQLWWKTDLSVKFRRNLTLYTTIGLDIYNNFNELNNPSQSTIPRVRSDIQEYLKQGQNNIQMFKFEYLVAPLDDVYIRMDFGLLEEMFGGLGGELYYRPFNKPYSFGLNAHRVRQRGYEQRFGFRDYENTVANISMYYDWPGGVTSHLLVGEYLAGDKGFTLDLSRRFETGFTLGVFATFTDLSAEEFGEGSFDKGFYFAIPTELFYTDYRRGAIPFGMHPLTKDGGALLNYHNSLYSIMSDTNKKSILRDWLHILD